MDAFTPGPWKCIYGNGAREFLEISIRPVKSPIKGLVLPVASVRYPNSNFGQANARLIAAAPDLYHALKNLLKTPSSPVREARAALAKAEGE